jgi:copper(I)-binding protein
LVLKFPYKGKLDLGKTWLSAFIFLVISGLALGEESTPAANSALVIEGAWVRALPPTQKMTAGYLRLTNTGQSTLGVVGASASIANLVEIHTTVEVDGLVRMQQLESLSVAAGESIEFAPGGTHLMLMGMEHMPRPGEEVQLCLQLALGSEVCTVASAQKSQPQDAELHKHHH